MKGRGLVLILAVLAVFTANAQQKGFKTDAATGVQYRFIKHAKTGVKGTDSNIAHAILAYSVIGKDGKDSDAFDSRKKGGDSTGALMLRLQKTYTGCLEQGILMMYPGDSAEFLINADSLYLKFFHAPPNRIPPGVTGNTFYKFRIKLIHFLSKNEVMAEQMKLKQKMIGKMAARKTEETAEIADYLKKNNYSITPDDDSIFYLKRQASVGKTPQEGDSVEVKYRGTFMDGKVFDPGTQNYKFKYGKNAMVIRGWISVLGKMHEHERVTVLIPSKMGYGAQGMSIIQPYTPLIFDMEIVSIKSNN